MQKYNNAEIFAETANLVAKIQDETLKQQILVNVMAATNNTFILRHLQNTNFEIPTFSNNEKYLQFWKFLIESNIISEDNYHWVQKFHTCLNIALDELDWAYLAYFLDLAPRKMLEDYDNLHKLIVLAEENTQTQIIDIVKSKNLYDDVKNKHFYMYLKNCIVNTIPLPLNTHISCDVLHMNNNNLFHIAIYTGNVWIFETLLQNCKCLDKDLCLDLLYYVGKTQRCNLFLHIIINNFDTILKNEEVQKELVYHCSDMVVLNTLRKWYPNIHKLALDSSVRYACYHKTLEETFLTAYKNADIVEMRKCINDGVDVNINNGHPLQYAVRIHRLDIVKLLVESGANVNLTDEPLYIATKLENMEIISYLIEKGVEISELAFVAALLSNNTQIIDYFLQKGAKITNTVISSILLSGDKSILEYILEKGIDLNTWINLSLQKYKHDKELDEWIDNISKNIVYSGEKVLLKRKSA